MAAKSQRVIELEEGICQAVAALDEAGASRVETLEAIDDARNTLAEAYGDGFEDAVAEYLSDSESEDDADDDDDEEDED